MVELVREVAGAARQLSLCLREDWRFRFVCSLRQDPAMAELVAIGATVRLTDQSGLGARVEEELYGLGSNGVEEVTKRRLLDAHEAGALALVHAALWADLDREGRVERIDGVVCDGLLFERQRVEYDEDAIRDEAAQHLEDLARRVSQAGIPLCEWDLRERTLIIELSRELREWLDGSPGVPGQAKSS